MANVDNRENVLVVENGKVYIYTVMDSKKGYTMNNLIGRTICPNNIINCIHPDVLNAILLICRIYQTPQLLYVHNNNWATMPIN